MHGRPILFFSVSQRSSIHSSSFPLFVLLCSALLPFKGTGGPRALRRTHQRVLPQAQRKSCRKRRNTKKTTTSHQIIFQTEAPRITYPRNVEEQTDEERFMLWTQRVLCRGTATPACATMPLREAARTARSVGCLGTPSHAASTSLRSSLLRPCLLSAAACEMDGDGDHAFSSQAAVQRRQRQLFAESHTPTEGVAAALTATAVNLVHVEGVVTRVLCGRMGSHPFPAGGGDHNRHQQSSSNSKKKEGTSESRQGGSSRSTHTVYVAPSYNSVGVTLMLMLRVEGEKALLAVRCRLSQEYVELLWARAEEASQRRLKPVHAAFKGREATTGADRAVATDCAPSVDGVAVPSDLSSNSNNSSSGEGSSDKEDDAQALQKKKESCVKAWATTLLHSARVVVSGQLRMEEIYDGQLGRVVSVPVVELPLDGLLSGVKTLVSE